VCCSDLDVSINKLSSLEGLRKCTALRRLNLDCNTPATLGVNLGSSSVTWLSLASNQLTSLLGAVPPMHAYDSAAAHVVSLPRTASFSVQGIATRLCVLIALGLL